MPANPLLRSAESAGRAGRAERGPALVATVLAVVGLCGLLLAAAPPVSAHTSLEDSDPEPGATVAQPLAQITLDYAQDLPPDGTHAIGLYTPDGTPVLEEEVIPEGDTLTVDVPELATTGEYRVRWVITAQDGDRQEGAYVFTYDGPVAAEPAAPATTPAPGAEPTTPPPVAAEATAEPTDATTTGPTARATGAGGDGTDEPATEAGTPAWPLVSAAGVAAAALVAVAVQRQRRS